MSMLAHGFDCDQTRWCFMLTELEKNVQVVLFNYSININDTHGPFITYC
jgi:hypothetical protein